MHTVCMQLSLLIQPLCTYKVFICKWHDDRCSKEPAREVRKQEQVELRDKSYFKFLVLIKEDAAAENQLRLINQELETGSKEEI